MKTSGQRQLEKEILTARDGLTAGFFPTEEGVVSLRFSSDEELFQAALSGGEIPRLKQDVFDNIDRMLLSLPRDRLARLLLEPPADSVHTPEAFTEIIRQNLRLRVLNLLLLARRNRARCGALLLGGCLLLALSYFLTRFWQNDVVFDVVNILGSLLIWTAGETYFLDQWQNRALRRKYAALLCRDDS